MAFRFIAVSTLLLGLSLVQSTPAFAAPVQEPAVEIDSRRGVDPSLDYNTLLALGPWDDRNYQLRKTDLAIIPEKDRYVPGVPAFFKVQKRREASAEGFPIGKYYPREFDKEFQYRFGGLLQNGVLKRKGLGIYSHPDPANPPPTRYFATDPVLANVLQKAVPVLSEGPFDGTRSDNETAIEYHPSNPNIVIVGSNGDVGQQMSRSLDGGATWNTGGGFSGNQSLVLPNSCCDPAMDWSPDGSIAYAATLTFVGGTSAANIRTQVYWSFDNGGTWLGPVQLSSAGSDKEYIHVDKNPASPFLGRAYVCWHQNNVQFFSRSTAAPVNGGAPMTFAAPTSFASDESGIGCDITTDAAGRVYFFYPSVTGGSAEVRVLRSSDGGVTFDDLNGATAGLAGQVYDLHGEFDFAIPAMETRRAFIYVAADVDISGGPRNGRVYAAFVDENQAAGSPGGGNGSAAQSHAWIRVVYSDDQGQTWQTATTPHSVADQTTVDRFNPWMDVDSLGNVHVGFYDTRHSGAGLRNRVDAYYVFSADGGTSWIEETRVSGVTSENIGNNQEWGDYNGLAVEPGNNAVGLTWTDNRIVGGSPSQRSFIGRVDSGPTYSLAGTGNTIGVCAGDPVPGQTFTLTAVSGFAEPVTLSTPGLNAAVFPSATFTVNPQTPTGPGATTVLNLTTAVGAMAGSYPITVSGTNGGVSPIVRTANFTVNLASGATSAPTLTTPADGAINVSTSPTLTWAAVAGAQSYNVDVATDAGFTSIVSSGSPTGTSFNPTGLMPNTPYFWRVRAVSPCGTGSFATARSFTTANEICTAANLNIAIPDNSPAGINSTLSGFAGTITDMNVKVNLNHTWVGDLILTLNRGATTVTLGNRVGGSGCQTDNMDATFDDEASAPVGSCAGSFTGSFVPTQALTAFDTQDFSGTWTLNVSDRAGDDFGTLNSWCLLPSIAPAGPNANMGVAISGPATQFQGQPITYTVTVTNAGPDTATSFTLADVVPAAVTGVTVGCVANGTATCGTNGSAGNNISFTANSLAAGGANSLVFTINGTVDGAFTGNLSNTASISAIVPGDTSPANNSATHNVNVTAQSTAIFADSFE